MQINKHGSFYIRNGWPTKIIDAIKADPYIFTPSSELNAVDTIGVGRVMIKAMRYWAVVLGLSEETKTQNGIAHSKSALGDIITDADPYFQDIGSLWLLHRNLARDSANATAWYWAFNEFGTKVFTKESFSAGLQSYLQKNGEKYAKTAIEKEFDCFKNTYVSDKSFDIERILEEDTVPFFAPLKLIRYLGEGKFEMRRSAAKDIPAEIALYCIVSDNIEHLRSSMQLSIDSLLEESNQLGKYMNLSYSTLLEILQRLENSSRLLLINNFGNRYIQLKQISPEQVLAEYYQRIKG